VDRTTRQIVDYTTAFGADGLSATTRDAAVRHIVDTVAVGIAGHFSSTARLLADVARTVRADGDSTVIGFGFRSTPEMAAFVNTAMVRTYDWNDGMQARGGGHPSDMIPGILATAELVDASGEEVLVAAALAYELLGGMGADIPIGDIGLDQGTLMGAATALSCGRLLGLTRAQLANAASLALVPNVPLGVSRWGVLSMMKGCATAFAVKNAVFAAQLAHAGMTSAPEPFEGIYGLFHVTGPFEPRLPVLSDGPSVIEMSHQKPVPAETQALALLELVPEIRSFCRIDEIQRIVIDLPHHAMDHIADPPKYDPQTRETADHSLPYMLAVALVDGELTLDSYEPERFLDPALRPLMQRIECRPDATLSEQRERELVGVTRPAPARISIHTNDGRSLQHEVAYYKGHYRNQMNRSDIDRKLDSIFERGVPEAEARTIRDLWWNIDELPSVRPAMAALSDLGTRGDGSADK